MWHRVRRAAPVAVLSLNSSFLVYHREQVLSAIGEFPCKLVAKRVAKKIKVLIKLIEAFHFLI